MKMQDQYNIFHVKNYQEAIQRYSQDLSCMPVYSGPFWTVFKKNGQNICLVNQSMTDQVKMANAFVEKVLPHIQNGTVLTIEDPAEPCTEDEDIPLDGTPAEVVVIPVTIH